MKTSIATLIGSLAIVDAFSFQPASTRVRESLAMRLQDRGEEMFLSSEGNHMERAKECAEKFGKCSVQELHQLQEELHQKRVQNVALGDESAFAPEDALQVKLIEQELALQLDLLKDETPQSYLFQNDGIVDATGHEAVVMVEKGEQNHLLEELVEEGALDSLAICALIGVMMFVPQFLN